MFLHLFVHTHHLSTSTKHLATNLSKETQTLQAVLVVHRVVVPVVHRAVVPAQLVHQVQAVILIQFVKTTCIIVIWMWTVTRWKVARAAKLHLAAVIQVVAKVYPLCRSTIVITFGTPIGFAH